MQRQMYSSPISIEQTMPLSVYTELRNVHPAFHPATGVDQNIHTYFPAYDHHHRSENYVDMTTPLEADINLETKRNVYKSRPIHYSSSDTTEHMYKTNDKGGNIGTSLSHRYQLRTHSTQLPDFESFFGPQQHHHSEMLVVEKDLTGYAPDGVFNQGVVEMNPRLAVTGKHSGLKETTYKKNVTQQYAPFHGNVMLQTSARNFHQSAEPSAPSYTDIRIQSIPKIVHAETENIVKPICEITRSRPVILKPFHCPSCPKSFSQTANLTAHKRIHSGEKPFQCNVCNKKFTQSSSVKTHMRVHTGERPYSCNDCGKTFADSSTLTKHKRIHSGDKPYQCRLCLQRFSQSGNLNRHIKVHDLKDRIA